MSDDPRVGATVYAYPNPDGLSGEDLAESLVRAAAGDGFDIVNVHPRNFRTGENGVYDLTAMKRVRGLADDLGIEIEPYVEHSCQLGDGPDQVSRATFETAIRAAKILGGPTLRTTYGRLELPTSRFSRDLPIAQHLAHMTATLSTAAAVAEAEEVVLAVENHCDFSGAEWATVIEQVNSPSVRIAFDTGNSWSVFADVQDDLAALAEYTATTHIKDLRIERETERDRMPFRAVGCVAGDGSMNISDVIEALLTRSPLGSQLPLIVELAWVVYADGEDRGARNREITINSVRNVRAMARSAVRS